MPVLIGLLIFSVVFHYAWHWLIWPLGIFLAVFLIRMLFENWVTGTFGIVLGTLILGILSYVMR